MSEASERVNKSVDRFGCLDGWVRRWVVGLGKTNRPHRHPIQPPQTLQP